MLAEWWPIGTVIEFRPWHHAPSAIKSGRVVGHGVRNSSAHIKLAESYVIGATYGANNRSTLEINSARIITPPHNSEIQLTSGGGGMPGVTSFKGLAASGAIKKTDIFRAKLDDLDEDHGFNLRGDYGAAEVQAHIESIATAIKTRGVADLEPLAVRIGADGRLKVVDGHCRRRAALLARESGVPVEFLNCLSFRGNDAARVAKMPTSNQWLRLTPLEVGAGYRRLESFGWTRNAIADATGASLRDISRCILLVTANSDVQAMVAQVPYPPVWQLTWCASMAKLLVAYWKKGLAKAAEKGGKRVTAWSIGRSVPKKITQAVVDAAVALVDAEGKEEGAFNTHVRAALLSAVTTYNAVKSEGV